jgi:hypothetical protein
MALMRGLSPITVKVALPKDSELGSSEFDRNAPLPGITEFRLADWWGMQPGAM